MNNRRSSGVFTQRFTSSSPSPSSPENEINPNASRRRISSSSKLLQLFHGNHCQERIRMTSFQNGLHELAMTSKLIAKIAETQKRGAEALASWAHKAHNAAIDDVMYQTSQLFQIFSEKQLQFAAEYEHHIEQLQKITEAEKSVSDAEQKVHALREKERKLKRDIRKGVSFFRQRRGGDLYLLRQELDQVTTATENAERTLSDMRAEMEVVKMFRFRHGMQGIADAYRSLAQHCQAIFTCHREITEMVPAIANQDVRRMIYDGTPVTRERVDDLKRSLQPGLINRSQRVTGLRRRSEPSRSGNQIQDRQGTPPPPYSPSAAYEQSNLPPSLQKYRASDSQLVVHHSASNASTTDNVTLLRQRCSPVQQLNTSGCADGSNRNFPPSTQLYPELPQNPYIMIEQKNQTKQTGTTKYVGEC